MTRRAPDAGRSRARGGGLGRWALPVVAVGLVAVAALAPDPVPGRVDGGSATVPVRQSTWGCPVQAGWTVTAGQVTAGTEAEAGAIPAGSPVADGWADASRWRSAAPAGDALVLHQRGERSGSVGFVTGRGSAAQGGGAVAAQCPAIVDDAWFVGLGDGNRSAGTVTLVNLGSERAVADLRWWGSAGSIESSDTTGIVVEAGQRKVVSVEAVTAGEDAIAVEVSRRRGALTAIATDAGPGGTELVAPAPRPARSQVLVGLPTGAGARLAVVNPGTTTAHVAVEVRGPYGSFAAQGLEDVVVEPQSTRVVAVPTAVELDESALHVTSDVAVVASATVATSADIASVTPAVALTGPAAVPTRLDGRPTRLALTAGDAPATVRVEVFDATMRSLGSSSVDVPTAATTVLPPAAQPDAAYLVVTPADGADVAAGLIWRDDDQIASAAVRPAPVTVVAPGVSVR